jgi:putative transposase
MARVVVPGYPHHVTQRGNRRQAVFLVDDDWEHYLALIRAACAGAETRVLAYCLMPNHVHFVLVPTREDGLRLALADAHRRYTRRVNFREGWRGHLWQDRFHSFVMDEPHLRAAIPYVENNPVRAGLCESPAHWPWSSASEACAARRPALVDWELRYHMLDTAPQSLAPQPPSDLEAIRLHSRTGRPLGPEAFIEAIEARVGRPLRPQKPGPKVA